MKIFIIFNLLKKSFDRKFKPPRKKSIRIKLKMRILISTYETA